MIRAGSRFSVFGKRAAIADTVVGYEAVAEAPKLPPSSQTIPEALVLPIRLPHDFIDATLSAPDNITRLGIDVHSLSAITLFVLSREIEPKHYEDADCDGK